MKKLCIKSLATAALSLSACGHQDTRSSTVVKPEQVPEASVEVRIDRVDLTELFSGIYNSNKGHVYLSLHYWPQGSSEPIIRWSNTNSKMEFNNKVPEESVFSMSLKTKDLTTGEDAWDAHLKSADFLNAEKFPCITFVSTDLESLNDGDGSFTGDITIMGVRRPFIMTGELNRDVNSGPDKDTFSISAAGKLKQSDFGIDTDGSMINYVEIVFYLEFTKLDK